MNRLIDAYVRLSDGLPPRSSQRLESVAARLCCGERNARLLLAKMQSRGWIAWTPGRGRGRLSSLTLNADPEALRVGELHRLLADGDLESAFAGLPTRVRDRLREALPSFLGRAPLGSFRMPFYRALHALDPIQVSRRTEAHLVSQLCPGLTIYDRERERVMPALAHGWEVSDDGRRWRFHMRPGLTFHDGRPVRGEDVGASLLRLRDTPGPHRALFAHLRRIAAAGEHVDLVLDEVDHLLPSRLAHHAAAILPAGDWRRPDFAALPIGTGAFRLVRNNEYRATLRRFADHWRERALLEEIDLWVVPSGAALPPVDLRLGHSAVPAASASSRKGRAGSPWRRIEQLEQGCDFVLLNPLRRAFASAAARIAIGHWVRAHVAVSGLGEAFRLATGWLPGWRHLPVPPAPSRLRPPPLPKRMRLVTYELGQHRALAAIVRDAFAAAGCELQVEVQPFPVFERLGWLSDADVVVSGEVLGDDLELDKFATLAGSEMIHGWLSSKQRRDLAACCRTITAEPDAARRHAAMEAAYARLANEGALLPMRHTLQRVEHAPHLGGVTLQRSGWMDFRMLWVSQAQAGAARGSHFSTFS